jgi:hypothetical protein
VEVSDYLLAQMRAILASAMNGNGMSSVGAI